MSEQPFKWLDWRNRFTKHLIQPLEGVDCFQENVLLNTENNLIVLNLSEAQFVRMFSALMTGAEISYPDESMQVVADFLKGVQCPPTLIPEECFTLPTYSNNIAYTPANPFIEPNTIPDGYLTQPFLVNGQNGNDFPTYEPLDVVVPFDAITFDIDFFEEIAGQLPTLEIMVQGTGSVNLKFLTTVQGGLVVVTLDNPPNLLDILAGIVTGAENIVDLNQDLVSLPPETAKELIYPVSVETGGIHTIYAVFLPILDDSLIPIRFGGGFRGLELCGFLPEGDMGLQNLRFVSCNLEQQNADGSWSVVDGWEDWLDCVPSGGGGGGTASIAGATENVTLASAVTTTSTTFNRISAGSWERTFTKSKAIVQLALFFVNSGASNDTFARPHIQQGATSINGANLTQARNNGATGRTMIVTDFFSGIAAGSATLEIEWRVEAGTGTINAGYDVQWVVIEYDDLSELFVQDIRIVGRELQKKINGAWLTVTDSLATILNSIEAIANNAAAAAANAQSTANNALTVANGAVTVNNTQNTRLTNLESDMNTLEGRVTVIETIDIPALDNRLDNLEIAVAAQEAWASEWNFLSSSNEWTSSLGTWVSGQGWVSTGGTTMTYIGNSVEVSDGRITHLKLIYRKVSGGFGSISVEFPNADGFSVVRASGSNLQNQVWVKVGLQTGVPNSVQFTLSNFSFELRIESIKLLGRGTQLWS